MIPVRLRNRLLIQTLIAALLLVGGTIGYHLIEGWSLFDGLYMTVITLATIGYGEVRTLSVEGRIFTMILIVIGVIMVGYLISNLTKALIENEIADALGRRRLFKDISQLKNHFILCGAGRVGTRIIDELKMKNVDFVVIERDEATAEKLLQQGVLVLMGDATSETVLEGARIREAKTLITSASTDAENVYIVLTARGMNPDLYIVTRANDAPAERQLLRAGANKVVSPVLIGSHRMAQAALSPAVADFIELTTMTESLDLFFDQVPVPAGSVLDGVKLKDSGIRAFQVMIVAITPSGEKMIFNPDGERRLRAGDLLIAIGDHAGLERLAAKATSR
ncbi:MAG: potassium channel family protein [Blastocatellia bacterium]